MRIFQKPKPNGKMEVSEDIFRNPKELEALKVKVKPEEYLKTLYDKIFSKEKELEEFISNASTKKESLEKDYVENKAGKEKEILSLESVLGIKRAEYAELNKPFIDRTKELDIRESLLNKSGFSLKEEQQKVFEKERFLENRVVDIQHMLDQLGEVRVSLSKEKELIDGRQTLIKDRELEYMAKIELFAKEIKEAHSLLEQEKESLSLRELNVQGALENIEQRETQIEKDRIFMADQRGVLQRGFDELQRKQINK